MLVSRALRPHRIDKLIVNILLRIVDHFLNIARDVVDQSPESDGVAQGQVVVTNSNRRVQIMKKQSNDLLLVKVSDRHLESASCARSPAAVERSRC